MYIYIYTYVISFIIVAGVKLRADSSVLVLIVSHYYLNQSQITIQEVNFSISMISDEKINLLFITSI